MWFDIKFSCVSVYVWIFHVMFYISLNLIFATKCLSSVLFFSNVANVIDSRRTIIQTTQPYWTKSWQIMTLDSCCAVIRWAFCVFLEEQLGITQQFTTRKRLAKPPSFPFQQAYILSNLCSDMNIIVVKYSTSCKHLKFVHAPYSVWSCSLQHGHGHLLAWAGNEASTP